MTDDRVAITAEDVWPAEADAEEAVVVSWFVEAGRRVARGERVCEIQVEKVDVDVLAPAAGTLDEIARDADAAFERGDPLGWIVPGSQ